MNFAKMCQKIHLKIHNYFCFKVILIIFIPFYSYIFPLSYDVKFMFQSLLPVQL